MLNLLKSLKLIEYQIVAFWNRLLAHKLVICEPQVTLNHNQVVVWIKHHWIRLKNSKCHTDITSGEAKCFSSVLPSQQVCLVSWQIWEPEVDLWNLSILTSPSGVASSRALYFEHLLFQAFVELWGGQFERHHTFYEPEVLAWGSPTWVEILVLAVFPWYWFPIPLSL